MTHGRRCLAALCLMALGAPVVGYGAWKAMTFRTSAPAEWMPHDFPARRDYEQLTEYFETGEVLVVSWPDCTVDDPRLDHLTQRLMGERQPHDPPGRNWFARVASGQQTLKELMSEPLNLSRSQAAERLRGTLIGENLSNTFLAVFFTQEGFQHKERAISWIRQLLVQEAGIPEGDIHLVGPIMDGYTVDSDSARSMRNFTVPSALVMLGLAWYRLRSRRVALTVFGLSLYCEAVTLALVYYTGSKLNPILMVMPPLILALTMAGGIHLVNYYFDALAAGPRETASQRALALGFRPCFLAAGTTAIGLASLLVSDIAPIREFGGYASAGVMISLCLLLLVIPGSFELWPLSATEIVSKRGASTVFARRGWQSGLARHVERHHVLIPWLALSCMAVAGWGIQWLNTSVRIETLCGPDSRLLCDYRWVEAHVGPLVPIEVLLHFDSTCPWPFRQRMELVRRAQARLENLDGVGGTMSAATFAPSIPTSRSLGGTARRAAIYRGLENRRELLAQSCYLKDDGAEQWWRITARVSAVGHRDYGQFIDVVRAELDPLLPSPQGSPGLRCIYTGVMPLVHEIQRQLMSSLFWSLVSALLFITLIVIIDQRGIGPGLVAMIPNVFPLILMFGLLGWLGQSLDIGSVMTASVALGMAIDGTLHFLTFYRRGVQAGDTAVEAARTAYEHCAAAMTESSLIIGAGMLVFALSPFLPGSRFAWMLSALLLVALYGDLVLLPALLMGPVGRLFARRDSTRDTRLLVG